jgi:TatD DNase family protein
MELIDIGINLAHDSYDADRGAVLERARAAGVVQMIVTGSSEASNPKALALAREHPQELYATAGIHPHHASEWQASTREVLRELGRAREIVAIGECGLDYFRDYSPRPAQRAAFSAQLSLAAELGKPVFLHQRDAHEDFSAIVREHARLLRGGVAHCFTGNASELQCYLELGLAIGITGWICDERRGRHLLPLVKTIPAERLLVETDGPYLLPRDLEPKPASRRNEPAYLPHIVAILARARGESVEQTASSTTAAARALFGLGDKLDQ